VSRWNTFPQIGANAVANDDLIAYSDSSLPELERSRTLSVAVLRRIVESKVIVTYAGSHTFDPATDLGAHLRFTAAATFTIPAGLAVGTSWVVGNATTSDTVDIDASAVTLLSNGVEVDNGGWVAFLVVGTNVVEAVGAFADAPGAGGGDVVGPASAVDDRIATFDGTTGKLIQDGGVTIAELVKVTDPIAINAQTGTTYTLVLADLGKLVTLANAGAITLTVPTNASVAFPVGTVIALQQMGDGAIAVEGATGVTINGTTPGDEALTNARYLTTASLTKHATDTWTLTGALA
jgi:hypothetical protein